MPANTLSRRIDQLEGQLGTRLLHRSTRKLAPSTEGQALFERYAPALDQILEIARLHADEQAPSGSVRVAAMAGLFGAAPSVALAMLGLAIMEHDAPYAAEEGRAMVFVRSR